MKIARVGSGGAVCCRTNSEESEGLVDAFGKGGAGSSKVQTVSWNS